MSGALLIKKGSTLVDLIYSRLGHTPHLHLLRDLAHLAQLRRSLASDNMRDLRALKC